MIDRSSVLQLVLDTCRCKRPSLELPSRCRLVRQYFRAVTSCSYYALTIGVEVVILASILRSAWTWPRTYSDAADVATADRLQQQAHA